MNFNNLINRLKMYHYPYWGQLAIIFYEEKLKEMNYAPKAGKGWDFCNKAKSHFSADSLKYYNNTLDSIELKHTWYRIDYTWSMLRCYVNTILASYNQSFPIASILNVDGDDLARHLQKIDDSIPEWKAEFKELCRENYRQVESILNKKIKLPHAVNRYLEHKIELMQVLYDGEQIATADDLKAQGLPVEKSDGGNVVCCKNMTIETEIWGHTAMRLKSSDYEIIVPYGLSVDAIFEIDRNIPQWIEEAKPIQHELQKQYKTKQIGANAAVAFTKCRMRELGCEYQLNGDLLEIKLLYDRKLAVRLPDTNMAKVKRILNHLPQHVAAINSVPAEYEIKSLSRTDMRSVGQATPEVACRMKQMGYNYSCYYDFPTTKSNKFELLEVIVQLPKNRELVLWKSKTQKPTDKILDEMPANIDAINSLPFYFRIRPILSCDKWVNNVS